MRAMTEPKPSIRKLREQINSQQEANHGQRPRVLVGAATCGRAAGALEVLDAFVDAEMMEGQARIDHLRDRLRELRQGRRDAEDREVRARLRSQVAAQETRLLKEIQKTNEQIERRIAENRAIRTNLERQARTRNRVEQIAVARWELVWE